MRDLRCCRCGETWSLGATAGGGITGGAMEERQAWRTVSNSARDAGSAVKISSRMLSAQAAKSLTIMQETRRDLKRRGANGSKP